jgi:hypothetical protein
VSLASPEVTPPLGFKKKRKGNQKMKIRKFQKLLITLLSLVLLIGSAVGIAASAEQAAPEIISQNIQYGANLRFKFAIDAQPLGEGRTVTVNVYDKNPQEDGARLLDSTAAVYEDVSKTNLGIDYAYVAVTNAAISALNYGTEYYAQAACDGVKGEVIKYSAVEYFLTRLYREGENVTTDQREFYENAIAYGSSAQKVMGDTKTNVADYIYVAANGGDIMVDGNTVGSSAILVKNSAFTIRPTEAVASGYVAVWKNSEGASYRTGSEMTSSESTVFTSALLPMLTFDGLQDTSFTTTANSKTAWSSIPYIDMPDDAYDGIFRMWNAVRDNSKAYPTADIANGQIYVRSSTGSSYFEICPSHTEEGYNFSSFEADITFGVSGSFTTDLRTKTGATAVQFSVFSYNMDTGIFKCGATNKSGNVGSEISTTLTTTGENAHTLNLKIEFYTDGYDVINTYYFNGKLVYIIASELCTDETAGNMDSVYNTDGVPISGTRYYTFSSKVEGKEAPLTDFSALTLLFGSSCNGYVALDNISFTQTKVAEKPDVNITLR